ncbi:MAG: thioesterase family protein [Gammaproteobacteria bacterium]|nr:thioesterase family protein [Gammaproteobacteria bacterium]
MFIRELTVGWGDLDANGHMANTAYLNKSGDVRMMYFENTGLAMSEFRRLHVGPVIRQDEIHYLREFHMLDRIQVGLELAGLAPDGSRFMLRNTFLRADGQVAATVTSTGGWLDLSARRLVVPPPVIHEAMQALTRTADFQELPSSIKS